MVLIVVWVVFIVICIIMMGNFKNIIGIGGEYLCGIEFMCLVILLVGLFCGF